MRTEADRAAQPANPDAEILQLRDEIDDLLFDLFEIRASREEVRRFYRAVGLVQTAEDQAATA